LLIKGVGKTFETDVCSFSYKPFCVGKSLVFLGKNVHFYGRMVTTLGSVHNFKIAVNFEVRRAKGKVYVGVRIVRGEMCRLAVV